MGEKYRPSNGTEGIFFFNRFCDHCQKDKAHRENPDGADGCPILGLSFALPVDHPDYPKEWIISADGPTCTAYEEEHDNPPRCDKTPDMFT